ncbi:hypothetical protein HNR39_002884 [Glaciimonas immobilis]|uniref:Uncharacterized protein n=1 Tax=Glaciimonas immobilis TaxID=728004 RepID=A0A840RT86_9BURK|nr:hypothetical protein [Glaciimonas immobilis]
MEAIAIPMHILARHRLKRECYFLLHQSTWVMGNGVEVTRVTFTTISTIITATFSSA